MEALTGHPIDPVSCKDADRLPLKVAILLALATPKCVSDIYGLAFGSSLGCLRGDIEA